MDNMQINREFYQIVSEIVIDTKSLRQFYDESQEFQFGESQRPIELRERKIKHELVNSIRHNNEFDYEEGIRKVHNLDRRYRAENYKLYKNIILHKIAEQYPFLGGECQTQKLRADMVTIVNKKRGW